MKKKNHLFRPEPLDYFTVKEQIEIKKSGLNFPMFFTDERNRVVEIYDVQSISGMASNPDGHPDEIRIDVLRKDSQTRTLSYVLKSCT